MIRPKIATLVAVPALALASLALVSPAAQAASAPSNDSFAHATVIGGLSKVVKGTTSGSTTEPREKAPTLAGVTGGDAALDGTGSVWYRWTAPASGPVSVSVDAADQAIVGVWKGASLATLTQVAAGVVAGADGGLSPIGSLGADFSAAGGATYYIQVLSQVDGSGAGEQFSLTLTPASISGTSSPTIVSDDAVSQTVIAAVDISLLDGLFDKLNTLMAGLPDDGGSSVGGLPGGLVDALSGIAFTATDAAGHYVLSGLRPGKQYLLLGLRLNTATSESSSTGSIAGLFYPGTQNPLRYVPLTGPAAGCSYVGLDVVFSTGKMSKPRLTCPLAPACQRAKATAPSAAALAAATAASGRATHAATQAAKALKKAKKARKKHPSAKLAKKVKRLSKKAKQLATTADGAKTTAVRLTAGAAAVRTACKPL